MRIIFPVHLRQSFWKPTGSVPYVGLHNRRLFLLITKHHSTVRYILIGHGSHFDIIAIVF